MRRAFNPGFIVYENGYPQPSSGGYIIPTNPSAQYIDGDGHIYQYLDADDDDADNGAGWYWYTEDNYEYTWYDGDPTGFDPYPKNP